MRLIFIKVRSFMRGLAAHLRNRQAKCLMIWLDSWMDAGK